MKYNHPRQPVRRAGLPMYRIGAAAGAADLFWQALADRLAARGVSRVPRHLDEPADLDTLWLDPALLLAQTCGYPLVTRLRGQVQLVATPCYRAEGCDGPLYRSALIVRAGDERPDLAAFRDSVCAFNSLDSNSGMNLLRAMLAPLATGARFFTRVVASGSHAASLALVASGDADIAAIDCVSLALLARAEPALRARVRIAGWSPATAGLPLITAGATSPDELAALRGALDDTARDPALGAVRDALLLDGFAVLPDAAYDPILALEQAATQASYPRLC